MDWNTFKQAFETEALAQGRSRSFVDSSLEYAQHLNAASLPIIFDMPHLCALVGYEQASIEEALQVPHSLYFAFRVAKRRGGFRLIQQPHDDLRSIQDWILRHILDRIPIHESATAFTRGRSIKLNAKRHVAKPAVLSLDIEDFFPSITATQVQTVFGDLGYSAGVVSGLTKMTTLLDGLPQGAPTSPTISNLVMRGADEELKRLAGQLHIDYSRYADDLTFSGRFHAGALIATVRRILLRHGFKLNDAKTRLMRPHQRQEVTGIVVNQHLQAPRSVRRALRQATYYVAKFGQESHEARKRSIYANGTSSPEHVVKRSRGAATLRA